MPRSNTILYVIGSLDVGGAEKHLLQVLPALDRRYWQPEIVCLSERGALASEFERDGVRVDAAPLRGGVSGQLWYRALRIVTAAAWLSGRLLWKRPRVVHFFLPEAYLVGGFCAVMTGRRHLIMSRRSLNLYQEKRPLIGHLERWLHPVMTVVLGNSRAVVHQLAQEGVRPERLRLIYNGIDLERLRPSRSREEVRSALGIERNALVLVKVANLIPYKGHADLLAALALACAKLTTQWRLICVGRDGGIGAKLQAEAAAQGLEENLLWLGERRDVADLLAASDIGLLCSHEEGFSNALLEKMAMSLPMIVTDVGGNSEAVLDGECGIVVRPHEPSEIAAAILELACDPERRRRMGAAGRARVEDQFSVERCVADYEALYRAIILDKRPLPGTALVIA